MGKEHNNLPPPQGEGKGEGGGEENKGKGVALAFTADESLSFTTPARHPATLLTKHMLQVDIRCYEANPIACSGN
jgi:hypothetical protein